MTHSQHNSSCECKYTLQAVSRFPKQPLSNDHSPTKLKTHPRHKNKQTNKTPTTNQPQILAFEAVTFLISSKMLKLQDHKELVLSCPTAFCAPLAWKQHLERTTAINRGKTKPLYVRKPAEEQSETAPLSKLIYSTSQQTPFSA